MDRWVGKVALVTGASSGIGASIAEELAKAGIKVFALARRVEKVKELKKNIGKVKGEIIPLQGDVSKDGHVLSAFKTIKEKFGTIHILVNNAGVSRRGFLSDTDINLFKEVFDTNVFGLINCTQQALKLMKESNVDDGHIIHINSIGGHKVPSLKVPNANVYPASKYAVTALTESLRQELVYLKSKIKITSISPGVVETEFRTAAAKGSGLNIQGGNPYEGWPVLQPKDLADAAIYVLSTPPHFQVHELTIRPIGENLVDMDRWIGKVALVTGASSGIGASIAEELARAGVKVFALARRVEKIEELKKNLGKVRGEIIPLKGDVSKENDVLEAFKTVKEKFGTIHILVNNAGFLRRGFLSEADTSLFREVFNVNVLGLINCTQQALKLMKESNVDDGHIIHINSTVGHQVPLLPLPVGNVYPASKFAVTALTESLRQELVFLKSKIKVSSVSPGVTETEFREAAAKASGNAPGNNSYEGWPVLQPKDLADAVLYVLSTPPHVQVHELTIKPVGEKF